MTDFGMNLKKLLVEKNITQKLLANWLGIDPVTLNRYVNGDRRVPIETVHEIAKFLKVKPQNLFGTDDATFLAIIFGLRYDGAEFDCIDIENGIKGALEKTKDRTFINPILRKYFTKTEMQDLVDSYGDEEIYGEGVSKDSISVAAFESIANNRENKTLLEENKYDNDTVEKSSKENNLSLPSFSLPNSLFEGENTESKQALLKQYFEGLSSCIKKEG